MELRVGVRGTFALLMLLSQKQDPGRNESYNLIKRCKCVEYIFFVDSGRTQLDDLSLSLYFFLGHGLYILFSSFF